LVSKKQVHVDGEREAPFRKDWVGHAFIILESPSSKRVVGFYPEQMPDFELNKPAFWCLGQRGVAGALLDDEEFLSDPGYECLVTTYPINQEHFARATSFVAQFERAVQVGRIRYHAFSQCASFAFQTLRAAGVGPCMQFPHPLFLHWWLND
jgi:hypothetical protein